MRAVAQHNSDKPRGYRASGPGFHEPGFSWPFKLTIDFPAMSDADDQHDEQVVFDLADDAEWAYSIFPEFAEARAVQSSSQAARIVELANPAVKELEDTRALLRVEVAEFASSLDRYLNLPRHNAS
jgi:hypothetical protein